MVDQNKEMQEEAVDLDVSDEQPLLGEERFKIINTVRGRHNRVQRMQHPVHARLKQHIGAGEHRVLRGRPLVLSMNQVTKHLDEIKAKADMGLIQVQTMDGRIVPPESLGTDFRALPAAAPPPVVNKPLDSANNDKNQGIGENMPQMPGGIALSQVSTGPDNTTAGGIPGPLENEGKGDSKGKKKGKKNKSESTDPAVGDDGADTEVNDPSDGHSDDPAGG